MRSVYFYCVPSPPTGEVPYQHLLVCLAEGLAALGVPCYANVDYWPLDAQRSRYLLRHDPQVEPGDCDVVIVSDEWFPSGQSFPDLQRARQACWVALDREDGSRLHSLEPGFRAFDFVLRTHYNVATRYHGNFVPWAYGLSDRIVRATAGPDPSERRHVLLANWRHTANPHSLRRAVERTFLPKIGAVLPVDDTRERHDEPPNEPYERVLWHETGRRHWPAYYERLRAAAACACFGGYFVTRWPAAKQSLPSRALKRALALSGARTHLVSQFDSWRLWESLAAGCATFHIDFARYGCVLPVPPVNWQHYVGVDLDRCEGVVERLRAEPTVLAQIGAAGRAWAREHYGPVPTAQRLLALVSSHSLAA
jgi:hypothetical protein